MKWESSLVEHLQWSDTITNRESKEQLARMIAMRVQEGGDYWGRFRIDRISGIARYCRKDTYGESACHRDPCLDGDIDGVCPFRHSADYFMDVSPRLDVRWRR